MACLIAIEGIDGSGKGTQAARLRETLLADGRKAVVISFPRYRQTRFGRAIGEFLNGRFGQLDEVHPLLASLLFAGDRLESKPFLEDTLRQHEIVICDRFIASNVAHQAAKLEGPERTQLMRWIWEIELEVYGLPRPDVTVLLDVPVQAAQQLISRKAARDYTDKAADLQEADAEYLERVRRVYLDLADQDETWRRIDGMADESLRPIEEIAAELRRIVWQSIGDSRNSPLRLTPSG